MRPDQCPCICRFQIVPQFCGHGVGTIFHASPMIMHSRNNEPDKMQLWQTFTIEPILCTGSPRHRVWPDKWTVRLCTLHRSALIVSLRDNGGKSESASGMMGAQLSLVRAADHGVCPMIGGAQ